MWLIDDNDDDDHKLFMWNAEPKLQIYEENLCLTFQNTFFLKIILQ